MNYLKKTGASQWCDWADALGKNGSRHWVSAGRRDEMKNKTLEKIYIDQL
jgi:hypothetical protein